MKHGWSVSWVAVGLSWAALGCNPPDEGAVLVAQGRISQMPAAAPPIIVGPVAAAKGVNSAPDTGASPIANATVDARVLVISAKGTSATLAAIQATLQYLGTPFDVLNASTGPALTADALASGAHGKYNAIFLDMGDLSIGGASAFSDAEWTVLTTYEVEFGVRRVSLYTSPDASYGFLDNDVGVDPTTTPISATCTAAGKALFVGTNCANPVVINQGYAYPTAVADSATTPLLVDAGGNVYAATRKYPDGREALALTFGQAPSYVSYLELAYGLVSWGTRGLFIGERHVYAMPQIDDLFLASAIYTGGVYRITDADMQAFANWQTATRANPLTAGFRASWACNGAGSSSRPGDPLTAKAVALGPTFEWINHTWDHPVLDALSYADVLQEFTQNDQYLRGLGLMPYTTINAVTPNISGLGSADAMRAIHDTGIQQIVSDTSVQGENNPSPNAGIWNALQPSVLEIPRKPTNLYFNVSQPAEWIPEYEVLQAIASIDYPTIQGAQSDELFRLMLNGSNDPWMFHQANTRNYDGAGHSLLSDLLDSTFAKYAAVMTFPVVSPTMDDLATRVRNRMALDASGVVATIGAGGLTITVAHAATIPVTGLCTPGAESYAGQTMSYLVLADGQTANYALGACSGATGGPPDPGSPDPGNAGAGGAGGANGSGSGSVDAGGTPDGGAVNGGSSTHVGLTSSPPMTAGCACALADGDPHVFVTVLCLVGCAISVRRRRARRA
jgi:peptidoglycan/xylan/chitin deacetylase (PgdA/CDA1 family)